MAVLRLFASAREAAGLTTAEIPAATVAEVLDEACRRFGDRFAAVLASSKVWVNGEPADRSTAVADADVVAVLPPVSGGAPVPPGAASGPVPPAARPHATPPVVVRGNLALVPELPPDEVPDPLPEAEP